MASGANIAARHMTLDELDALIAATPNAAAALLTVSDWRSTMQNPAAMPHQGVRRGGAFIYRGVWLWVTSGAPSRVIDRQTAEQDGLLVDLLP